MHSSYGRVQQVRDAYCANIPELTVRESDRFLQAYAYLVENIWKARLTVDEIMKTFRLNGSDFYHRFKFHTGYTPKAFINYHRVECSKRLLQEEALTIGEVALFVGFSSHSTYCKAFKRVVGCTPSEWKSRVSN